MPTQIVTATGTSQASGVINSTKARVVTTAAIYFSVGTTPTAIPTASNTAIISPNTVRYINMQGLGNKIAYLQVAGGGANVEITDIGTVYGSGVPNSTYVTT